MKRQNPASPKGFKFNDEMSMPCINLVPGVDVVDPMTDAGRFVVRSEIRRDVGASAPASGFWTGEKLSFGSGI